MRNTNYFLLCWLRKKERKLVVFGEVSVCSFLDLFSINLISRTMYNSFNHILSFVIYYIFFQLKTHLEIVLFV